MAENHMLLEHTTSSGTDGTVKKLSPLAKLNYQIVKGHGSKLKVASNPQASLVLRASVRIPLRLGGLSGMWLLLGDSLSVGKVRC